MWFVPGKTQWHRIANMSLTCYVPPTTLPTLRPSLLPTVAPSGSPSLAPSYSYKQSLKAPTPLRTELPPMAAPKNQPQLSIRFSGYLVLKHYEDFRLTDIIWQLKLCKVVASVLGFTSDCVTVVGLQPGSSGLKIKLNVQMSKNSCSQIPLPHSSFMAKDCANLGSALCSNLQVIFTKVSHICYS